jgi:hypothetical protein
MATLYKDGITIKKISAIQVINNIQFILFNNIPRTLQEIRDVSGTATKLLVAFKQRANKCFITKSNM